MNKRTKYYVGGAVFLLWFFNRSGISFFPKKIGPTLFGRGMGFDIDKPVESLENFFKVSKEESAGGFKGSIKPKGIHYIIQDGTEYNVVTEKKLEGVLESRTDENFIAERAVTIYEGNYTLVYNGSIYPPSLVWLWGYDEWEVYSDGSPMKVRTIRAVKTIKMINYSNFRKN